MTMFHFGNYKPVMTAHMPLNAKVCFCWGEIDCRCHVFKHPPFMETIDELVKNYFEAIEKNVVGRDPKDIWIYNVVPPPQRDIPGRAWAENPGYPFLGNDQERLSFVRHMNEKLRETKYTFVDLFDRYSDENGFLNLKMSDDGTHVSDPAPLQEWINAHT
jgi:hypothetical protein